MYYVLTITQQIKTKLTKQTEEMNFFTNFEKNFRILE